MKQRIDYIDLAKGFCILLVILNHTFGPLSFGEPSRIFSCFRMPLYFFLSGLFFKKYAGLVNFTLRKTNKLLIPFVFFLVITYLFYCVKWLFEGRSDLILQLPFNIEKGFRLEDIYINGPLWFFVCLFETSAIFYLLTVFCDSLKIKEEGRKVIMAVICFLVGLIGFELGAHKIDLPLWIDTSLTAIPFYYTGSFLREKTNILLPNKLDKFIPVFLLIFGMIVYLMAKQVTMVLNEYQGSYLSFYVVAISGTLFVLLLSKLLLKVPVVSFLGRYSVIVLCTHMIAISILNRFFSFFIIANGWLSSLLILFFVALISIPVAKFFLRFFPKFVCQKDLIKVD
ncbi:acyltransferase family protein [uncultured Bacteroides sp.]|uniref:acyltransferase family protein n=1 Tax=uncultured Bacteroides sp. TaxID=162156 RepID=UPI002AABBD64|nr:acyltransferase family protein [uncultured Bacteroides sp.]